LGCDEAEKGVRTDMTGELKMGPEDGMTTLNALIKALSEPEVSLRDASARATHTCKLCGGPARRFRNTLSEFEYRVSAICQNCQDRYFNS